MAWAATQIAFVMQTGPYIANSIPVSSGMFASIHSALKRVIPSSGSSLRR